MKRILPFSPVLALALAGCGPSVVEFVCSDGEAICGIIEVLNDPRELATGVDITEVYLYQAVEMPLMQNGVEMDSTDIPVVIGRDAMVRVLVTRQEGWQPRTITGRLYLYTEGHLLAAIQSDVSLVEDSDIKDLTTTFNFKVPGEVVVSEVSWQVELVEAAGSSMAAGSEGVSRWPSATPASFTAEDPAGGDKVFVVPIQYDADGSGRLPDTSETQVELLKKYLYNFYPTPRFDLEIGDVLATDIQVSNGGGGWSELLTQVADSRAILGVDDDQYLYGLFTPTESEAAYGGGVYGLSMLGGGAGDAYTRVSIGLGFTGDTAGTTMVHEVGHAHGLLHSPGCGAADANADYPDMQGKIDVRGYDLLNEVLYESDTYFDMMSYCTPYWISAYNFDLLFDHIQAVNNFYLDGGTPEDTAAPESLATWHTLWILPDGNLRWGRDQQGDPSGAPVQVDLFDVSGGGLGHAEALYTPMSELGGGLLRIPADEPRLRQVRWNGLVSPRRD